MYHQSFYNISNTNSNENVALMSMSKNRKNISYKYKLFWRPGGKSDLNRSPGDRRGLLHGLSRRPGATHQVVRVKRSDPEGVKGVRFRREGQFTLRIGVVHD